jgi:hypothetical protein
MSNLDLSKILNIEPHPLKKQLADNGISVNSAAIFMVRSYSHTLNQLNGKHRMMPESEAKITELIELVKQSRS